MDVLRNDNKQLQTACFTELQTDYKIHDTTDQDFPSLKDLTQHLNEGILISSEITSDEESHFEVSDEDAGLLLVWGCGEFGQHGHGHQNDVTITAGSMNHLILGQDGLVALVACGSSHTIVITDDNRIYSWGNCNSGQLGIGDSKTMVQPHLVQLGVKPGTRIKGVTCGTRHTFIWTEEGDCFSFGNNFSAQLGYDFRKPNFKENQIRPIYLETLFNQKVHQVACGSRHSLFLFTSGSVASVGSNDRGQLGHSDKTDSVCIQKVADVTNVSIIGCGNCHCLAADRAGNVYAWGYGKACGFKEDILSPAVVYMADDSTSVACLVGGDSHSLLLLNNGKLFSWGNNFEGQLGLGTSVKFSSKPTEVKNELAEEKLVNLSVGENTSAAITESGRLFMWGKNVSQVIREDEGPRYCQYVPHPVPLGEWKATKVACGAWHVACIVSPDTRLNTWDWTPPRVDIPVTLFEPQQDLYSEDVSFSENNSNTEENSKYENVVHENSGYTEKDCTSMDGNTELIQCENDSEKIDAVDLVESETSVNNEHKEKECYAVEKSTENTLQNETPKVSADNNTRVGKDNLKDNNSGVKIIEQIHSQKDRLAGVLKKKRSHSAETYTKHKMDKTLPKDRNSLQRNSSDESVKPSAKPLHISKSLCNIVLEKSEVGEGVNPERRRSTGTIRSTSRINSRSAGIRNAGNQIQSTKSLSSGSISMNEDVEHGSVSQLKQTTIIDETCNSPLHSPHVSKGGQTALSSGSISINEDVEHGSVSQLKQTTIDETCNSPLHSAHVSKGGQTALSSGSISMNEDVEHGSLSPLKQRTPTDEPCNLPLPSAHVNLSKGGRTAQLNREKKAPRHLRKIPSVPKMEYYLPNQPIHGEEFSRHRDAHKSTISRTQSNPNIITNHQSDIHAITLSMPSSSSSCIHMPHPPPPDGLPPRHPRFKKKSAQKIVFSSGSSWRKRSSNI